MNKLIFLAFLIIGLESTVAPIKLPTIIGMSSSGVTPIVKGGTKSHADGNMLSMVDGAEGDSGRFEPNVFHNPDLHSEENTTRGKERVSACGDQREGLVSVVAVHKAWITRASGKYKYQHMPTLAISHDGRMVAAWQGSRRSEGSADQSLWVSQSSDHGRTWSNPTTLHPGRYHLGARWSPVLFQPPAAATQQGAEDRPHMYLFFSESKTCWHCYASQGSQCSAGFKIRMRAPHSHAPKELQGPQWRAGGDIMVVSSVDGKHWSSPRKVYSEADDGPIPKVISNPPAITATGTWVLPFWRQAPRGEARCKHRGRDYSAVLLSQDLGATWHPQGHIAHAGVNSHVDRLIEGSVVALPPARNTKAVPLGGKSNQEKLVQYFRTTRDTTYSSASTDGGRVWSAPSRVNLPNPNTKTHMIVLTNGAIMIAYNHHKYKLRQRSNLFVAVSTNQGSTWKVVAKLETHFALWTMYHYPTLVQDGCHVFVTYADHNRGIRLATLDISFL